MHETTVSHTPVLIIGAGPVGLSSALFLARQGISSLLVERHPGVSIHPRSRGITARTMELMREVGLEEAVRAAGSALENSRFMLTVDTLAGAEIERNTSTRFDAFPPSLSAATHCLCAQDELEPLLVAVLQEHGVDLRFGTELVSFEQDTSGVTATIVERASGTTRVIHADYLIATDGAQSSVRQMLGIPTQGRIKPLAYCMMSIYFRADLSHLVQGREFIICFVRHPAARGGILVSVNNTDRWIFMTSYNPEHGTATEQFTPERTRELVRQVIGLPQLEVELLSNIAWEATDRVADHFQSERVFLAGDAAHVIPPAGGFGMNIGIQDAHNLAWKLALVIQGTATSALLTTYEIERRPQAQAIAEQANLRMVQLIKNHAYYTAEDKKERWVDDHIVILGHQYSSQAIIASPSQSPFLESIDQLGRPGTRAPHIWMERQGKRISTLDLFGLHFVLFVGTEGQRWQEAVHAVATRIGLTLDSYRVGQTDDLLDPEQRWYTAYGITPEGAVLVRPDGFVAWRAESLAAFPYKILENVFDQLLGRIPYPS